MDETKEVFLKYPEKRDVLFVFGAGASHPDGVPLQADILPLILNGNIKEIQNSKIGKIVIEFISDNFFFKKEKFLYPKLEAVFGFIDYFIQQKESLSLKYTNSDIINIKEYLIKIIHYVINLQTNKESQNYKMFWKWIDAFNRNISIITLNYDTLLEESFKFLFPDRGIIDYAIPFMNYYNFKDCKDFNFWINSREPIKIKGNVKPFPYKILKIHGSLNWKYCNCCNQTLLTPWDKKIDLYRDMFLGYTYPEREEYEYRCPLDKTDFQTLILPPSYLKGHSHPILTQLMSEAGREIRSAKKIVFVGYSLSNADIHIKALFKKQLTENVEIIVVNKRNSQRLKSKYRALKRKIKFIDLPFEELVKEKELMKEILSPNSLS